MVCKAPLLALLWVAEVVALEGREEAGVSIFE